MLSDLTYCDFLIFAPLTLEISAIEVALKDNNWKTEVFGTSDVSKIGVSWMCEATLEDTQVAYNKRFAIIVQLNNQGVLNAAIDTAKILEFYEPGYIISFGIAGSLDFEEAPIGSVVCADLINFYEPSKDKSGYTQNRSQFKEIDNHFLVQFRRNFVEGFVKKVGPVASGEKLVADVNSQVRKRILMMNDKTLAVEMEAAGVIFAASKLCKLAEPVVIKGISDLADKTKNKGNVADREKDRAIAASNAASVLADLMKKVPLRREFRNHFEVNAIRRADDEAKKILDILSRHQIRGDYKNVYACLYDRRGQIPCYYHWRQYSKNLHWIDFKILAAIKDLPVDIIQPLPIATVVGESVNKNDPWYSTVFRMLGVAPVTDSDISDHYNEISSYVNRIGFTASEENVIRSVLSENTRMGDPTNTLNLMKYILGQFCHRRIFIFTWKEYIPKWENMSKALGIWFSIFNWETIELNGKRGKQEPPGKDLNIEPGEYTAIQKWLDSSPDDQEIKDFLRHFECHVNRGGKAMNDGNPTGASEVQRLLRYWEGKYFSF